jgi:hypothetical protein
MVKAPSGGAPAPGMTSAAAAMTGGPPSSSSSASEPLMWWFHGVAYAAMAARVGSKFARGALYL